MSQNLIEPYEFFFQRNGEKYVYNFNNEPYDAYLINKIELDWINPSPLAYDFDEDFLSERKKLFDNLGDLNIYIGKKLISSVPISFLVQLENKSFYNKTLLGNNSEYVGFKTNMEYFLDKMYIDKCQEWSIEIVPKPTIPFSYNIKGKGLVYIFGEEERERIYSRNFSFNYSEILSSAKRTYDLKTVEIEFNDCRRSRGYYIQGDIEDLQYIKLVTDSENVFDYNKEKIRENCQIINRNLIFIPVVPRQTYNEKELRWLNIINHNKINKTVFSLGFSIVNTKRQITIFSESLNTLTCKYGFFGNIYG